MKTNRFLRAGILVVCTFALAIAAQAQNMIIYSNTLVGNWQNWGWGTINYANTSPVYPGFTDSVSVSLGAWQGIQIVSGAEVNDSPYYSLTFELNGGTSGGQNLQIYGLLDTSQYNEGQTPIGLSSPVANTWVKYTIPLASLGVQNLGDFTGFVIQDSAGTSEPTFYLDDIELSTTPPSQGPQGTNAVANIGIDAASSRQAISPMIYGVAFASGSQMQDLNATGDRSGGNEESTYNWELNAHGKGADWYFETIADSSSTPGESADTVVQAAKSANAQALITIPMMSWGPTVGPGRASLASYSTQKYGPQTATAPDLTIAGNGVTVTNGISWDNLITWNNPTDAYIPVDTNFQKGYVKHLITNWGTSTSGGVGYYIMDNEHSLWSSTHQDIHPVGPTMQEILGKMESYASMVKSVDSNALVLGPEEWGWNGYLYSGYDQQWSAMRTNYNPGQYPDRQTNGGMDYMPWLLSKLAQYQATNGQRLLDYFTLHCYPQEGNVGSSDTDTNTELLRNQTTRQFWDTNYTDPSWINSIIMLIPRMKSWVNQYYPGTKIGVTEYNWGGESSMNGATAQADILGIFGKYGLDLATRWTVPANPTYQAIKMYRNYDGNDSTFGDTSVLATGPNPDNLSVFASERSKDGALTIMVVNKYLTGVTPVVINLTNYVGSGTAQVWQLNYTEVITQLANLPYSGGQLQAVVPPQSVTLFVIPPSTTLSLTPGAPRTDGNIQFTVNGEIGGSFVLLSSTDLAHWTRVSTNSMVSGGTSFLPPASGTQMFYKAQWITP
jgi:hypothetical protein